MKIYYNRYGVLSIKPFSDCIEPYCRLSKIVDPHAHVSENIKGMHCRDHLNRPISCNTGLPLDILSIPEPHPGWAGSMTGSGPGGSFTR